MASRLFQLTKKKRSAAFFTEEPAFLEPRKKKQKKCRNGPRCTICTRGVSERVSELDVVLKAGNILATLQGDAKLVARQLFLWARRAHPSHPSALKGLLSVSDGEEESLKLKAALAKAHEGCAIGFGLEGDVAGDVKAMLAQAEHLSEAIFHGGDSQRLTQRLLEVCKSLESTRETTCDLTVPITNVLECFVRCYTKVMDLSHGLRHHVRTSLSPKQAFEQLMHRA